MSRSKTRRKLDKKIFRNTANRSKDINLGIFVPRGGIRL